MKVISVGWWNLCQAFLKRSKISSEKSKKILGRTARSVFVSNGGNTL